MALEIVEQLCHDGEYLRFFGVTMAPMIALAALVVVADAALDLSTRQARPGTPPQKSDVLG